MVVGLSFSIYHASIVFFSNMMDNQSTLDIVWGMDNQSTLDIVWGMDNQSTLDIV